MLMAIYLRGNDTLSQMLLFFILFFLPNILLFVIVILSDTVQTRKFYSMVLVAKIIIQGIGLPVALITLDNTIASNYVCKEVLEIDGMKNVNLTNGLYFQRDDPTSLLAQSMISVG